MSLAGGYTSLIHRTQGECHFLWGPVSYALLAELQGGNKQLMFDLSTVDDPVISEILIGVLSHFGLHSPEQVHEILDEFIAGRHLQGLLSRSKTREKTRIAIEAAQRLAYPPILIELAQDSVKRTQLLAVRTVYHLSKNNPNLGLHVVRELSRRSSTCLGLPRILTIRSCLLVSLLMLQDYNAQDKRCQDWLFELQQIWQSCLEGVSGFHSRFFRKQMLHSLTRFGIGLASGLAFRSNYLREIAAFFKASEKTKDRFLLFVEYLDPNKTGLEDILPELVVATEENDPVTAAIVALMIVVQGRAGLRDTLQVGKRLFYYALNQPKVGVYPNNILVSIGKLGVNLYYADDEFYYLHERMCRDYLGRTKGYFSSNLGQHWNCGLGEHVLMRKLRGNPKDENLSLHFLQQAVAERDWLLTKHILEIMVYAMGTAFSDLDSALEIITATAEIESEEFRKSLISVLRGFYRYYPALVSAFLESDAFDEKTRMTVKTHPVRRSLWEDSLQVNTISIMSQAMQHPAFCRKVLVLLQQMPQCRSLSEFAVVSLEAVLALVSGTF